MKDPLTWRVDYMYVQFSSNKVLHPNAINCKLLDDKKAFYSIHCKCVANSSLIDIFPGKNARKYLVKVVWEISWVGNGQWDESRGSWRGERKSFINRISTFILHLLWVRSFFFLPSHPFYYFFPYHRELLDHHLSNCQRG